MGVGKTTVCQRLKKKLPDSVFLDGDWCWDSDPFQVTEETKSMVTDNICHLLNNFISCSAYENVIFCWVMDREEIIKSILEKLNTKGCQIKIISLVCSPDALKDRLNKDIEGGRREKDVIARSLSRQSLYDGLDTIKIDTTDLTVEAVAEKIIMTQACPVPPSCVRA